MSNTQKAYPIFALTAAGQATDTKRALPGKNFRAVFFDGADGLCYNIRRETRRLTARR